MKAKTANLPKPLLNFVLLKLPPDKEEVSTRFIAIKDKDRDNRSWVQEGEVLAIGTAEGCVFVGEDKSGDWFKPEIKVGDTVYYSSFTDHKIDKTLVFVKYKDIVGVKCTK